MPNEPDQPGGSHDPTRANDPVDPTRAQDPVDPTRVQPGVDPTRAQDAAYTRPDSRREPVGAEPLQRDPHDDGGNGAGWLWALLAAVLIGIVLFALLRDNDDDDVVDTDDTTETVPAETTPEDTAVEDTAVEDTTAETSPEEPVTEDTTTTTAAEDDGAAEGPGTVTTADGTDLFTLVEGDDGDAERLAPYAGETVTGDDVRVLEIVDGEGFWIGADDEQRIFARASDDVTVEVDQRVRFSGILEPIPADGSADAPDIPEDQGGELLLQQGHYIELGSVEQA